MTELTDEDLVLATPIGFAAQVLKKNDLYWWQDDALTPFEEADKQRVKVSVVTPNGSGKSSVLIPTLVYWWLTAHKNGVVVITSKDSKQLDNQIWPALLRHRGSFPQWRFIEREIHNGDGGFCIGFTTDEPGRAEGWHKLDDIEGPLLIIVDEAKSVQEKIFEAIDRCTFNGLLYVSSPGLDSGTFYDSQTKPHHGFTRIKVGLTDCPHIPKERINDIIGKYGIDHPFTRSTLFGEFMSADAENIFVFQRSIVRSVIESPPNYEPGGKVAAMDFAAGRNENVLCHKQGNKVLPLFCWKDPNTMAAVGQFIIELNKRNFVPSEVYGDAGGMGKPFCDRFEEMNWPINRVNNDEPARDSRRYVNRAAEMWFETASLVMQRKIIIPDDDVLVAQLCTRKIKPDSSGRLGLETKKEMKKRGIDSPDRADGFCMSCSAETVLSSSLFDQESLRRMETMARTVRPEFGELVRTGDDVTWNMDSLNKWLNVWERPKYGQAYLAVLNCQRHDEAASEHTLMVLRTKMMSIDKDKKEIVTPARMVARVRSPFKVGVKELVDYAARLVKWYGYCPLVPIVNERGDIVDALLQEGVEITAREDYERIRKNRREAIIWGWETTEYTRSLWMGALGEAIRDRTIDVEDLNVVMQLSQLNAENAKILKDAEAIGVGLKMMGYASTNLPRRISRLPRTEAAASMLS
jgi:phage terminase large subunit